MKQSKLSARIFKIKPGKKDQWISWCKKLDTTLRDEAIATLKEENILRECYMVFSIDGNDYTIGITDDFGDILPSDKLKEINQLHRKNKQECLSGSSLADTCYDIKCYN